MAVKVTSGCDGMIPENEHVTLGLVLRFVAVLRLLDFRRADSTWHLTD